MTNTDKIKRDAYRAEDYGYVAVCPECGVNRRLEGRECDVCGTEFDVVVTWEVESDADE